MLQYLAIHNNCLVIFEASAIHDQWYALSWQQICNGVIDIVVLQVDAVDRLVVQEAVTCNDWQVTPYSTFRVQCSTPFNLLSEKPALPGRNRGSSMFERAVQEMNREGKLSVMLLVVSPYVKLAWQGRLSQ